MQVMARAAKTGSNFFLFSFFSIQIRIFLIVLRRLLFAYEPVFREDTGTIKKTGIPVNQVIF
jgi:hypothetical protein